MSLADELRLAGLVVLEGRSGRGQRATSISTEITGTGQEREGADDINTLGLNDSAVCYVERSGRVWLLADGPLNGSETAVVKIAAHRKTTEAQDDAVAALLAVLGEFYGLDAPKSVPDAGAKQIEGSATAPDDEETKDVDQRS